jgi:hypothetical protein
VSNAAISFARFLAARVTQYVGNLTLKFVSWQAAQHITRFSDYRLEDIGFERDWDGSIGRQNPDPKS